MIRKPLLGAVAALCLTGPARAEDTDDIQGILSENVITTASTSAQKASTAPATSITVTAEELRLYGIRSIAEAVNFLSVGLVASDPLRTPELGSRGVLVPNDAGKHFLLLVNGHAQNDPLYGAARFDQGAGIPIDLVDHIEATVGPGSVLYGSNAMLGVINVITKDARAYRGGHVVAEYEPGRTERASAGLGATFSLFGQPSEITVGAEYFRRFGPDLHFDERSPQTNRGNGQLYVYRRGGPADGVWGGTVRDAYFVDAPSGMVRLRSGDFEMNVLASAYRRGIPYTTGDTNVDFDDAKSFELDRSVRVDLKHEARPSSLVGVTSRVYGDSFDYQRRVNRGADQACFRSDFATCQYYAAGLARWVGLEERLSLNWLGDLSLVTLLGVDARMRWVSAKEDALDLDTGRPFAPTTGRVRAQGGLVSPYVQQTWSPTSYLDLNAGARLDIDPRFDPILSPRGAIALTPFDKTTFRFIYSEAFRAPTWSETDSSGYHQAAAHRLEPERARSVEASIEERFGSQRLLVGVFRTSWDNLVEPRLLSLAEMGELQRAGELPITAALLAQQRNVSSIENYGWNGSYGGALARGRLAYGANVTAAYTRRTSAEGAEPLPVAPQLFGNLHASYAFGGYAPTPAVAAHYVGKRPLDRAYSDVYSPIPYAQPFVELRTTLTGALPVPGLAYRVSAAFMTAEGGAYIAGPRTDSARDKASPALTPLDRFSVFVGLRYDFAGGESSTSAESGTQ